LNLTFLHEAENDYLNAFDYYAERSETAARAFIAEFENAISQVQTYPRRWRKGDHGAQVYHLRNFPYALVYKIQSETIVVVAVSHHRRKPGYWRERSSSDV